MKQYISRIVLMIVLSIAAVLSGCSKSSEMIMKEIEAKDGTFCISVEDSWIISDMGSVNEIAATSKGEEEGFLLTQFPVRATGISGVNSLEDVKKFIEEANQLSDITAMNEPEMQGMKHVEAYTASIQQGGESEKCCLVYGETDYAYYVLFYYNTQRTQDNFEYIDRICATFRENEVEEISVSNDSCDTINWFNAAAAILTKLNNLDYTIFGGSPVNDSSQEAARYILEMGWDVTDKESAEETLAWLFEDGQQTDFSDEMSYLTETGIAEVSGEERVEFLLENFEVDIEQAEAYAFWYELYEMKGEKALKGWDYSRAMSLLANCYLAGYYTENEALDSSLEVAQAIQESFNSWDDYMESYFAGYEYWSGESSDERRAVYEDLKAADDNPFNIDFNMELEKNW